MAAIIIFKRVARSLVLSWALMQLTITLQAAGADPQATNKPACYQLNKVITCADDISKPYCQSAPRGVPSNDSCQVKFSPQEGKFTLTCPAGNSGNFSWNAPPSTWCSDQELSLETSANFQESGKISGKYWHTDGLQLGSVSGSNPFDWLDVEVRNSSEKKSATIKGVHPQSGLKGFSLGIVASGWSIKPGGNATDSVGGGVEYVYTVAPASPPPPIAPKPTASTGASINFVVPGLPDFPSTPYECNEQGEGSYKKCIDSMKQIQDFASLSGLTDYSAGRAHNCYLAVMNGSVPLTVKTAAEFVSQKSFSWGDYLIRRQGADDMRSSPEALRRLCLAIFGKPVAVR